MAKTDTFLYRVINDKLDVAKATFDLLMSALYAEELLGQNTQELISSTPRILKGSNSTFYLKAVASVVVVGAMATGVHFFAKKNN